MDGVPIFAAHDVLLARGNKVIYSDFSIRFGLGITVILGPNGTGKTTLLEGLADPATLVDGRLEMDGREVGPVLSVESYFASLGFLPQKWSSYRGFTVRESLRYVAWLKGMSARAARKAADSVIADFDLAGQAGIRIPKLSGGLQQRVGLAEAFVNAPRLVLLDEPTVGLDPQQRSAVRSFLRARAGNAAIVVSTHLTDDVEAMADRVLIVDSGSVLFDGPPTELAAIGFASDTGATPIEAGYLTVIESGPSGGR